MISMLFNQYRRTSLVVLLLVLIVILEIANVRDAVYPGLLPIFEWVKYSSWIGILGTTYGSVYATIQAVHLLSMAVIGGVILTTSVRLLGVALKDVSSEVLNNGTQKIFKIALIVAILSGIFCAAGVSDKVYYMQVFWIKMLVLALGSCFELYVKQPLLNSRPHNEINVWTLRMMAGASILIWFTVAATGRWIGFS